jgi:phosphate starvation-inducible protein PhoH
LKRLMREEIGVEMAQKGTQAKVIGTQTRVVDGEGKVIKRCSRRAGLLEKWKQRKASQLTSEIAQRRRGMLPKLELDFIDEDL